MRRRTLNFAIGTALLTPGIALGPARGQDGPDLEAALAPRFIGSPDAAVTLIEYFSLTCGHCARFHADVFPKLRQTYIDTGRLRMELRDFPLDQWALRSAALARCVPVSRHAAMVDVLLKQQDQWIRAGNPTEALLRIGQLAGLDRDRAIACMSNEDLLNGIIAQRLEGTRSFDVNSTPSFVFDGRKVGIFHYEEFVDLLEDAGA